MMALALLSMPISAQAVGHRPIPEILGQIVKNVKVFGAGLILPFSRKEIRLEDSNAVLDHQPKQKLGEEQSLIKSRGKTFPWEEYQRLEQSDYLTQQELNRFLELQTLIHLHELEAPEAQKKSISHSFVPGMCMAGCGQSAKVVEKSDPIATEIKNAEETGVLDLNGLAFTSAGIQEVLASLPIETAAKIT
ncbi:MAG: hypothetical protein WCK42_05260, partial [Myxococcaceae bacterium]